MNKNDLVKVVAEKSDLIQKDVAMIVDAFFEETTNALKKGEEVSIAGFGKFVVKKRASRTSINPRTGEKVSVPSCKAPAFRAGKALKDAVNK